MSETEHVPIEVLYVGDPEAAARTRRAIESDRRAFEVRTATDDDLTRLTESSIDCILGEHDPPETDGLALLDRVREVDAALPVFLRVDDEDAVETAISAGVTDVLPAEIEPRRGALLGTRIADAVEAREHVARRKEPCALGTADARFRSLAENAAFSVITIDEDNVVQYANEAVEAMFGYAPEEMVGDSLDKIVPDRLEQPHFEAVSRYLREGDRRLDWDWTELPASHRDGHEFPVGISFGEYVEDGSHLFTGVIRDITERKRHQRDLEQYEAIIEAMDDAVYVLDGRGRFEFVNGAFTELTGYEAASVVGEGVDCIKDPETTAMFERVLGEMLSTGIDETTVEFEIRTEDGERIPCEDHLAPRIDDGEFNGVVGAIRDVSERRERQRELDRKTDLLEHTQRMATVGGWELDLVEETLRCTDEVYRIHGLSFEDELNRESVLGYYHPEDVPTIEEAIERAIKDGDPFDIEARITTADGNVRWVRVAGKPHQESGETVLIRGAFQDVTEQKRHERMLAALHDATRELMAVRTPEDVADIVVETVVDVLDHPLVGVHYHDPDTDGLVPIALTPAAEEMIGRPPTFEAGSGLAWEAFETGEAAVYDDVRTTSEVYNHETPIRSGMYVPLGDHGVVLVGSTAVGEFDESDLGLVQVLAANAEVAIDRSDREQALREHQLGLARERDRFAALFDYIPDPAVTVDFRDGDLIVTSVNDGFEEVFGYDAETAVGRSLNDLIVPPDRREEAAEIDRTAMAGEQITAEVHRRTADGDVHEFLFRNVPIDSEGTEAFGIYTDVSEHRRHEEYRRRLYELWSDTDTVGDGRIGRALELGREYLDADGAFLTRLEDDRHRILEVRGSDGNVRPDEEWSLPESYCQETIGRDGPVAVPNVVDAEWDDDPVAGRFGFDSYVTSELAVNGERYGLVCFASRAPRESDFTNLELAFVDLLVRGVTSELERRNHERELERQNERLEGFASLISHDLRNPLTVASGYLEVLDVPEEQREFLGKVQSAHDRMERIIEDVLTLARQGKAIGETRSVSLAEVVEDAWENVETAEARLVVDGDPGCVAADGSRLEEVFENLFRNAIEHGSEGVTCRVGATPDGFYVEDDGPGVPAEDREAVFEYGHTTTESGTGLGLSIVSTIVEAHGWTVTVTDGTDGGARFEFSVHPSSTEGDPGTRHSGA